MDLSNSESASIHGVANLCRLDGDARHAPDSVPPGATSLGGRWGGWVQIADRAQNRKEGSISAHGASLVALDGLLWGSDSCHDAGELANLLATGGKSVARDLRGSFTVFFLDHRNDKLFLFADHIRSRNLFWHLDESSHRLVFSSSMLDVVQMLRAQGHEIRLDTQAAWHMLTFGYMLDSRTLVEGVRRVSPGSVVIFDGVKASEEHYYRLTNAPVQATSRNQIVDGLEDRFRAAIRATFTRDADLGYGHVMTLSGGLDSRSVAITATQMGFRPILTCTASVSGYLDQTIAARVAKALGAGNVFYSLDNGSYLADLEPAVRANGGLVFATGSAHILDFLRNLDLRRFGMLHTGMVGDAVLGTYLHAPHHEHLNRLSGANSTILRERAEEVARPVWLEFDSDELYLLYTRGFNAVLNGFHSLSQWIISESPFLDTEFLSFALSIPPEVRFASTGAGIYRDWILAKRGKVGKYRWERTGVPAGWPTAIGRASQIGRAVVRRAGLPAFPGTMVPMARWYEQNDEIANTWTREFRSGIGALDSDRELRGAAERVFSEGKVSEKGQVLTLLIAMRALGIEL